MALNLSTLTSPATSGDVLAEALTTADFLEPCPVLRNLSRGSNKGGDAKQDVALNQPKALPLIDRDGYLYLPPVSGNYASTPDESALDITGDITFESDFIVSQFPVSSDKALISKYNTGNSQRAFVLQLKSYGHIQLVLSSDGSSSSSASSSVDFSSVLSARTRASVKVTWRQSDGRTQYFIKQNGSWSQVGTDQTTSVSAIHNSTQPLEIGSHSGGVSSVAADLGVFSAKIYASINDTNKVLDVDFTATSVRHGDTKFKCATNQIVTINQDFSSSNDVAKIIKKPVLRFDGVNTALGGLLNQTIDSGYFFAAFSVLGNGGEASGRVFGINSTGEFDYNSTGLFISGHNGNTSDIDSYYGNVGWRPQHDGMFDDANGDILHELKFQAGAQRSRANNADERNRTDTMDQISAEEFKIGALTLAGQDSVSIDLEYLALFSVESVPDEATASKIRNYINNRNLVFLRHQTDGYYFYDAQSAPVGAISSGSSAWNGRIVGSDNGDTDRYLTQGTSNDAPVGDGFKVTFADNTDHLEIPQVTQAGWQIVGTSLGTFVYRINGTTAVTELNLLGNLGNSFTRKVGDLYGIILLPASATNKDIQAARKLLIDRGASDGAATGDFSSAWRQREDIVEFNAVNMSSVTNAYQGWYLCNSLSDFKTTEISNSTNFTSAWQGTSLLQQFPSGAKLGTSATNVNFTSAWQSSGLTSFPALDLSNGTNFSNSFTSSALTSFSAGIKMGTSATGDVQFNDTWRDTTLSSFPALDLGNGKFFNGAWRDCHELTSFPSDIKLGTNKTGVGFIDAWRGSGLTSFPALDLSTGTNFNQAFFQATSLQEFGQCDFSNGSSFDLSWYYCSALTTFPSMQLPSATSLNSTWMGCNSLTNFGKLEAPNVTVFRFTWSGSGITTIEDGTLLGTSASSVDFTSAFKNCIALTTLPSNLNLSQGDDFQTAFQNCQSLVDFPANAFDTMGTPQDYCFLNTWLDNNALSAASVENILVSINTSGQSAPSTGPEITIKYNTATGSLTAATNAAIDSLSGKGWQVYINGEQIIPNILTLQPAAAYSLRSFDADADPNVVNVRRSSDGATSDFTASEVSDGTLTTWVNTDVDLVTPTVANGGFEDGLTGWSTGGAVLDTSVAYAGSNSARFDIVSGGYKELTVQNSLQIGNQYKVTFWAKVSDSSASARADFGSGNLNPVNFSSTDWEYKEVTGVASGSTSFRFARDGGSPVSDFTVNFDNVTLTQLTADGHVTTWYDQGGTNHATQSTASSQPKIVDAGTLVTEGGLAAVDFDGTDDYFQITNNIFAANFEAAVLANVVEDNTKYQRILDISNGTDDDFMVVKGNNNSLLLECNSTSGVGGLSAQFGSLGVINNYSLIYATSDTSTNSYTASVNGVSQSESQGAGIGEGNFTLSTIATRSDFLASSFAEGTFQEIVLFNTDQSANRTGIEAEIMDTYSIS